MSKFPNSDMTCLQAPIVYMQGCFFLLVFSFGLRENKKDICLKRRQRTTWIDNTISDVSCDDDGTE